MSTIQEIGMKRFHVDRREGNTIAVWSWFGWRLLVHLPFAVYIDYWVYVSWDHLPEPHVPFKAIAFLIAGLATYTGCVGAVNRISMSVSPDAIQVKHYPLPIYRNVSLSTDEVQSLYVKRTSYSSGSNNRSRSHRWQLVARMKSGLDRTVLPKAVPRETSLEFKDLINRELEEQRLQA